MSRRQQVFTAEGLESEPRELTEKDRMVMRRWKTLIGQCPWCLFSSNLWDFATFIMKRKNQTVSESNCRCPECSINVKRQTLINIYNMDMKSYGDWFWDAVFSGSHGKVSWEPLKRRLREGFSYEDVQPFWTFYWQHKELSLSGWEQGDDDAEYDDYIAQAEESERQ